MCVGGSSDLSFSSIQNLFICLKIKNLEEILLTFFVCFFPFQFGRVGGQSALGVTVNFLWPAENVGCRFFLNEFLIFEISTRKSHSQPNFDGPPNPES